MRKDLLKTVLVVFCLLLTVSLRTISAGATLLDGEKTLAKVQSPDCGALWSQPIRGTRPLASLLALSLLAANPTAAQTSQSPQSLQPSKPAHVVSYNDNSQIEMTICTLGNQYTEKAEAYVKNLGDASNLFAPETRSVANGTEMFRAIQTGGCQVAIAPLNILAAQAAQQKLGVRPYHVISEIAQPQLNLFCSLEHGVDTLYELNTATNVEAKTIYVDASDISTIDTLNALPILRSEFKPFTIKTVGSSGSAEERKLDVIRIAGAYAGCGAWVSPPPDRTLQELSEPLSQTFSLVELNEPTKTLVSSDPLGNGKETIFFWDFYSNLLPGQPDLYGKLRPGAQSFANAFSLAEARALVVPVAVVAHHAWLQDLVNVLRRPGNNEGLQLLQQTFGTGVMQGPAFGR